MTNNNFYFVSDMKQTLQSSYEGERVPRSVFWKRYKTLYYFHTIDRIVQTFKAFSLDSTLLKPRHCHSIFPKYSKSFL